MCKYKDDVWFSHKEDANCMLAQKNGTTGENSVKMLVKTGLRMAVSCLLERARLLKRAQLWTPSVGDDRLRWGQFWFDLLSSPTELQFRLSKVSRDYYFRQPSGGGLSAIL